MVYGLEFELGGSRLLVFGGIQVSSKSFRSGVKQNSSSGSEGFGLRFEVWGLRHSGVGA